MNLLSRLLPDPASVRLETWSLEPAPASITVTLRSRPCRTACPLCGGWSRRTHSRYERTLADLPWGEHAITIKLGVRRMFCDNASCKRQVFTERLPGVAAPWARRTARLAGRLTVVGLALGGSATVLHESAGGHSSAISLHRYGRRTYSGRPSSSIRFSALTAIATSVARR